jgi:hypothetical protein
METLKALGEDLFGSVLILVFSVALTELLDNDLILTTSPSLKGLWGPPLTDAP